MKLHNTLPALKEQHSHKEVSVSSGSRLPMYPKQILALSNHIGTNWSPANMVGTALSKTSKEAGLGLV